MDESNKSYVNDIIELFIKNDLLDYWIENGEMVYTMKEKYKNTPYEELNIKY